MPFFPEIKLPAVNWDDYYKFSISSGTILFVAIWASWLYTLTHVQQEQFQTILGLMWAPIVASIFVLAWMVTAIWGWKNNQTRIDLLTEAIVQKTIHEANKAKFETEKAESEANQAKAQSRENSALSNLRAGKYEEAIKGK